MGWGVPQSPCGPSRDSINFHDERATLSAVRRMQTAHVQADGGQAVQLPGLTSMLMRAEGWGGAVAEQNPSPETAQNSSSSDPTTPSCIDVVSVLRHVHINERQRTGGCGEKQVFGNDS